MLKKIAVCLLFALLFFQGSLVNAAEGVSFKIEMLPWEEVNQILPRYAKFTVLDIETGKQFHVQRRAGSNHADVQPLTSEDTRIMKKIYSGKWSWKRRAIIVIHKDQWIAASMHGMPHGAGALKNNFPGHFCIHFYGSTTHRTKTMDFSHMLMIFKAAGKLDVYLDRANPYEAVNAFVAGLKQQDTSIVSAVSLQQKDWSKILPPIKNVKITSMPLLPEEDLKEQMILEVPIEVNWEIQNRGSQRFSGAIRLLRFSPFDRWKVDANDFLKKNQLLN